MNKDRGTIKWTAMMLPEHVKLLREWQDEDKYIARPEIDEWTLQQISEQIQYAYERKLPIQLTIWEETQLYKVHQYVKNIDINRQKLTLQSGECFSFADICGATLID